MTVEEMITYDQMVEMGIATADELNLAFNLIGGPWSIVFDKIVYIRTGYHSFEQYIQEEMEREEEDEEVEDTYMLMKESLEFTGQWW